MVPYLAAGVTSKMADPDRAGSLKSTPLDVLLLGFHSSPEAKGRRQYIFVPTLLEHTGVYSSSKTKNRIREIKTEEEYYKKWMKVSREIGGRERRAKGRERGDN